MCCFVFLRRHIYERKMNNVTM
jgi:hypothetical protein